MNVGNDRTLVIFLVDEEVNKKVFKILAEVPKPLNEGLVNCRNFN